VLILVNRIDHGKTLADLLPNSIFVSGSDEAEYRNSVLDRMRTDDSGIFIATPIYDEGIDVPAVDTIILAAGGKSHVKLLQRIGRGLRKKENKENILTVHDFLDDTNMYLLEHSQERADTYASEKFETIIDK
jgi:superfamily II DNA or RNA helicase